MQSSKQPKEGKLARVFMPIIVFLLLGLVIGYGTWYYQKQSETAEPKKAEEKIQTPPDVSDDSTTVGGTGTDTTAPTDTTTTNPDTPVSSDATADYTMYTVKSGDTLSGIANDHDMTSSELAKYNGLKDAESLQIGQKIKIPN